jgi:hypothetical protein
MLHEYHVIYEYIISSYPRFHINAVGLGTCYPWIRGHYCIAVTIYYTVNKITDVYYKTELVQICDAFQTGDFYI